MTNCNNVTGQVFDDTEHVVLKTQILHAVELTVEFINTQIKSKYQTLPFYFSRN
jgi:hypothetical protein